MDLLVSCAASERRARRASEVIFQARLGCVGQMARSAPFGAFHKGTILDTHYLLPPITLTLNGFSFAFLFP